MSIVNIIVIKKKKKKTVQWTNSNNDSLLLLLTIDFLNDIQTKTLKINTHCTFTIAFKIAN